MRKTCNFFHLSLYVSKQECKKKKDQEIVILQKEIAIVSDPLLNPLLYLSPFLPPTKILSQYKKQVIMTIT